MIATARSLSPTAASTSQGGRLPLHIAAMHRSEASEAVVRLLFRENPAGAKEKDKVCTAANCPSRDPRPFLTLYPLLVYCW
jgi:hypothetical protein